GRDYICENYDIPKEKILLYNNVINVPDVAKLERVWRDRLGIGTADVLISMIANITRYKDHRTLLSAWRIVRDYFETKQRKLILVCAGRLQENVLELKSLGFDLGIGKSVKFPGAVQNVNELVNESDLVVHSSNVEGCPNSVCEAMALGKAVVATDIPGDREALTATYEQYCLSRPNDPEDLAEKIIFLIENPSLREEVGRYNKRRIAEHYNEEQLLDVICPSFVQALQ
ncbi:MAG: glycosyltransferase, partial [Candidatus Omnitrophica bacterium]|nr:glycosyltransferase [Candidatus Omnitrophota bacterium]